MACEEHSVDDRDLAEQIAEHSLSYPERENGTVVLGSPFLCEFDGEVDPEQFCNEIRDWGEPWHLSGVQLELDDGYWSVAGNLRHMEDGEQVGSSEINLEVCSEWVRVYVKQSGSEERVAEFVRTLDEEYGITVDFPGEE